MCPDNVLTAPMNAYITGQATDAAAIIAGTQAIPACGDNAVRAHRFRCHRVFPGEHRLLSRLR